MPSGWNQAWRRPLRQGLDRLRDALAAIFQEEGASLLHDPWAARDDYIDLLLDASQTARGAFFHRHQARALDSGERARAVRLLEMQHQAMLMFTSCGWFFAELSGLETVQVLKYAARAVQLAREAAGVDLEPELAAALASAPSNRPDLGDGRQVYERLVRPSVATRHRDASGLAGAVAGAERAANGRRDFRRRCGHVKNMGTGTCPSS